jgi:hypothetical protein
VIEGRVVFVSSSISTKDNALLDGVDRVDRVEGEYVLEMLARARNRLAVPRSGGGSLEAELEAREDRRKPICFPSQHSNSPTNTVSSQSPAASLRGSMSLSPTSACFR